MSSPDNASQLFHYPEHPNTELFSDNLDAISDMYRQSFAGAPWYEDLSSEDAQNRLRSHMAKPGFAAFVVMADSGKPVGGLWYDTPSLPELIEERGADLGSFAINKSIEGVPPTLVWARETVVHPDVQGRGVASGLRSDNFAIMAVARKFGYAQTGIKTPALQNPAAHHEYWYKLVNEPEKSTNE